jgi:hypothetical protein
MARCSRHCARVGMPDAPNCSPRAPGQKIAAPRITWTFSFSHNDLVRLGVVRATRIAIVASATQRLGRRSWRAPARKALEVTISDPRRPARAATKAGRSSQNKASRVARRSVSYHRPNRSSIAILSAKKSRTRFVRPSLRLLMLAFRSARFDARMRNGWRIARRKGIGKLAIELRLPVRARGFLLWSLLLRSWFASVRRRAAKERTRSATVPAAVTAYSRASGGGSFG